MACSPRLDDKRFLCDFSDIKVKEFQEGIFLKDYWMTKIDDFKILPQNIGALSAIFAYFHGNTGILSLDKGLYVYGGFGSGKTTLFLALSKYLANVFPFSDNGFSNASLEQVSEEYKNGTDERGNKLNSVSKFLHSKYTGKPIQICFHELGKEINEKYYGTDINQIMNSLMMQRYELQQTHGTRTHCTSNFHPSQLKCFDKAVLDRFKEMFNFIEWHGESFRK